MQLDPSALSAQETYKLLIGGITPRPIAWVSSISASGVVNLAPFSFFTVASANPPVLAIAPLYNADGVAKDTLNNIREQGEFVVNTVSADQLEVMNQSCHNLAPEVNEFEYAGVEPTDSSQVAPPRVASSTVSYECRARDIIDLGDGPMSGHLILGDVLSIHVADDAINDLRIDSDKLDSIGRMAGADYSLTRDRIQLSRT